MEQRTVIGSYRVESDVAAIRRHSKQWLKKKALPLTLAGAAMGLLTTFLFFLFYLGWGLLSRATNPDTGFLILGAGIVVVSIGLAWQYAFSKIDLACKAATKWTPSWETHILESGIEVVHDNGIVLHIPLTLMKILMETEDGWTIEYAGTSIVLFRKALRDAGLEEEFLKRVGAAHGG